MWTFKLMKFKYPINRRFQNGNQEQECTKDTEREFIVLEFNDLSSNAKFEFLKLLGLKPTQARGV